jgi:hypothetical protein
VRAIEPFPVRRLAAVCAAATCTYLALANHYAAMVQPDFFSLGFGAPPPPNGAFAEGFLELPGVLAGLPVIIGGSALGLDWVTHSGLILGATFFWYCAGWYADRARNIVNTETPPRVVAWYISTLAVISAVMFPVAALAGLNVGQHFCANGVPPYWSEVLTYGIVMSWVTVGTFFAWRRFRRWREQKRPPLVLGV